MNETAPGDLEQAGDLVRNFLKEQADHKTNDGVTVSFKRGVLAFLRRSGTQNAPTLFVSPINSDCAKLTDPIKAAIRRPRDPTRTSHFSEIIAKADAKWGFSLFKIEQADRDVTSSTLGKMVSGGELGPDECNSLDLLTFDGTNILRVPIAFLGSPILLGYFDCVAESHTATVSPQLEEFIYSTIAWPLSSLLAVHMVMQISHSARDIVLTRQIDNVLEAQTDFLCSVACLLVAKEASLNGQRCVLPDGTLMPAFLPTDSPLKADFHELNWEILLPAFKTYVAGNGDAGLSSKALGVSLLQPQVITQVNELLELIQRAAKWQEKERALASARLVGQMENDLRELLRHTEAARQSALKVDAVLMPSREDFLRHFDQLRHLFDAKVERYYGRILDNDMQRPGKVSGIHVSKADLSGFSEDHIQTLKTSHKPQEVDWEEYRKFLNLYGANHGIALFSKLAEVRTDDQTKAGKLFSTLKLMCQRPHASPERLFAVQVAVACAIAWDGEQRGKVLFAPRGAQTLTFLDAKDDQPRLLDLKVLFDLDESLLNDQNAYALDSRANCDQFLGTLMRLLRIELVGGGKKEDVCARSVSLTDTNDWLEIEIACDGCFSDPERQLSVTDTSYLRGLRSLIGNLCVAVGQTQPHFARTVDVASLRSTRKRFSIGLDPTGNGRTALLISFPKIVTPTRPSVAKARQMT